jgi:hypothetical protein
MLAVFPYFFSRNERALSTFPFRVPVHEVA